MSSHHVIRENQEPALLIQDFEAIDFESIGQLLEWSPTIVSDFHNFDILVSEGIKVDVLFSNEGSIALQEHTKLFPVATDYLVEGIAYLIKNQHKAVNVLSSYIPKEFFELAESINIVLFKEQKRYVFIQSSFEKWKPKGEYIYLDEKYVKSFQGLDYISTGIFKSLSDGFVQVEFNTSDYVLLGEDL